MKNQLHNILTANQPFAFGWNQAYTLLNMYHDGPMVAISIPPIHFVHCSSAGLRMSCAQETVHFKMYKTYVHVYSFNETSCQLTLNHSMIWTSKSLKQQHPSIGPLLLDPQLDS